MICKNQRDRYRNSLAVQWLRLGVSLPWTRIRSLVGELRSHKPCNAAKKKKKKKERQKQLLSKVFWSVIPIKMHTGNVLGLDRGGACTTLGMH